MTLLLERPGEATQAPQIPPAPQVAPVATSRAARSIALVELMGRRPELRDLGTATTIATDALLWAV